MKCIFHLPDSVGEEDACFRLCKGFRVLYICSQLDDNGLLTADADVGYNIIYMDYEVFNTTKDIRMLNSWSVVVEPYMTGHVH